MTENSFEPSHEQTLLGDSVRELCRSLGTGRRDDLTMRRNWTRFAQLGWLMAGIPEAAGGLGAGLREPATIAGELAAGLATEPYLACGVLAPQVLVPLIEVSPASRVLIEAVMAGEHIVAVAGDLSPRRTVPQATRKGDRFDISGLIPVVAGGGFADSYLIPAELDGEFLLLTAPGDHDGLRSKRFRLLDGSLAAEIALDCASFETANILARGELAERAMADAIERTTVIAAADLTGATEAALWQTRDYLKVRRQFGAELASFQALQHRMADMYIGLQLMYSILHYGMAKLATSDPAGHMQAASACKILASKRARDITGQAIQLHGGIGVTEDLAVGQYFRRVSVVAGQFGNLDSHVDRLGSLLEPDAELTV